MNQELNCHNCKEEIVLIIDNLFFSEKTEHIFVECPSCNTNIKDIETDGWLFIRTKKEFEKDILIENSKERYIE